MCDFTATCTDIAATTHGESAPRARPPDPPRIKSLIPIPTTLAHLLILAIAICLAPLSAYAASVTNVSAATPNGAYRAGSSISIDVSFSANVTVTGAPQLQLETGVSDGIATYSSGSGTSVLRFVYTVSSGHTTSDLDYQAPSSLSLAGGSITTENNTAANLTLPSAGTAGSLSANSDIRIDTTAPTVTLQAITPLVTNSVPIRVLVTFSESVSGFTAVSPTVTNGTVSGISGSGASYTLDITPTTDGNVTVQVAALAAFDSAQNGNTASSTLTVRYDTVQPTVVRVTASPTSGAYRAGLSVSLVVVFTEAVTVVGSPSFTVETGASDGTATYLSGSGSTQLTFRYTVQSGHTSADLEYTANNALVLNGGSIRDAATNDAVLTLPDPGAANSLSVNANIIIDTTLPGVTITSPISGDTALDAIPVVVTFSEAVTGFALSDLTVTNGCASNLSGSGTTYYVDIVPRTHGLVVVSVPSSVVIDIAGNPNTAAPTSVQVNFFTSAPKVTSVTSSTPNGAYRPGQTISIQVSFTEAVAVTGTPQLRLATGSIASVNYSSGSGTDTLTFDYTIQTGQNSNDLDYIPLPPLSVVSGEIRDQLTNSLNAALTFACPGAAGSLSQAKNIIVDTINPTISRVTSTTTNGAYRAGQTLNVRTQFSENVFVTGTPTLTLETGPSDAVIDIVSGSGSANIDFSYTIVDGHNSNRLDYTNTSAFALNGATIIDQAGNVAVVTLPTQGSANSLFGTKNLIVDTIPPTVPNITSSNTNGSYKAGTTLSIQVGLSETIFVTGTPRLALATGVANRFATYSSGSGTSSLLFSYTVGAGDTTLDLDYTSTAALETNGGSIRDQAGNDTLLALATPGNQFSLSFNKDLQLDTTAPTILEVASLAPSGVYSIGTSIPISILFSEPVQVGGVPSLLLNTGPSQASAAYVSGSGTAILTFSYTVAAGQNTSNLDYASTAALMTPSGGFIRDSATNSAVLTLPLPGAPGSLSAQAVRIIDTVSPSVSSISFVSPNGFYRAGMTIDIDVLFSELVQLSGALQLQLNTNSSQGLATCTSSTNPATTFRCTYTINSGDTTNDLDYQNTQSLALGAGPSQLTDLAGNSADRTLPTPGSPSSLAGQGTIFVDTTPPTATLSSTTHTVTNANPIPVTITFSESISGLSLDDFEVTNGTLATLSGSGSSYTGNLTPLDQGAVALQLRLNTVADTAGNLNSASNLLQRTFDSVRPSVSIDSSSAQTINITSIPLVITFSEPVTQFEVGDISVVNGTISSFTGSGTTYTANLIPTSDGTVVVFIPENIAIDTGGNGNTGSDTLSRLFDSTAPQVLSVTSSTPDGNYRAGAALSIQVVCSESVIVTGAPQLSLATGTTIRRANYESGSGTETLTFTYTVVAGDNATDLDYSAIDALLLESSSIEDLADNSVATSLPNPGSPQSLAGQKQIVIDTQAPEGTTITSPQSGSTIKSGNVEIRGLAEAATAIVVRDLQQSILCSTTTTSNGEWSCLATNLLGGTYTIRAVAEDQAGNTESSTDATNFVIDLLALDAPQFTEPKNGASAVPAPIFAGTAPPNKQVHVRSGALSLCVAHVSAEGTWSCQSTVSLNPGRYAVSGVTEDPENFTTSAATPLVLTIGSRLTGIVLQGNRDLTPARAVSIGDGILSTTTDSQGVFSMVVPDPDNPQLSFSKFGWRFERAGTLSAPAQEAQASAQWIAVPALEPESYTIWNGNISHLMHSVRVLNKSTEQQPVTATLFQSDGSTCAETFATKANPLATVTLDLNQSSCIQSGSYGLVKISFPNREYDAILAAQNQTTKLDSYLASYNELPLANTVRGKSYAFFDNAYHTLRGSKESFTMRNELIISNPTASSQQFTVRRYNSRGTGVRTSNFSIPAMGSYMVPFDKADEESPQNGLQEVEPHDVLAPYIAIMVRSGVQQLLSPRSNGRFIHMNYAQSGSGNTLFTRVRHLPAPRAIQYVELANVTAQPVNIQVRRIGQAGHVRPTIPLSLAPYETRKLRLSRLLARYEEGVAEIATDTPNSILVNSVMKHYRGDNRLLSMKSNLVEETFGDLLYGTYSARKNLLSILKISNLAAQSNATSVTCYAENGNVRSYQFTLEPGNLEEVKMGECFGGTATGIFEVNSSLTGSLVADLLRFRRREEITLPQRLR